MPTLQKRLNECGFMRHSRSPLDWGVGWDGLHWPCSTGEGDLKPLGVLGFCARLFPPLRGGGCHVVTEGVFGQKHSSL
jgi:hypothetical protein